MVAVPTRYLEDLGDKSFMPTATFSLLMRTFRERQMSLTPSVDSFVNLSTLFRCGMGKPNGHTHQRKDHDYFVHRISCFLLQANPIQRNR